MTSWVSRVLGFALARAFCASLPAALSHFRSSRQICRDRRDVDRARALDAPRAALASGNAGSGGSSSDSARARSSSERRMLVRAAEVVRLLEDRVADALELPRRLHHLDERALDA